MGFSGLIIINKMWMYTIQICYAIIAAFTIKKLIRYVKFRNHCSKNQRKADAVLPKRNSIVYEFEETKVGRVNWRKSLNLG